MLLYVIKLNDKFYVGITTKSFRYRLSKHISKAKHGSNYHFHNALRKYGIESGEISTADGYADWKTLVEAEKTEILRYDSFNNGYNMTEGGEGTLGARHTIETKIKMSKKQKGKTITAEQRLKQSKALKGKYAGKNSGAYKTGQIHGTLNSYNYYGCRCDECRKAYSNYYKGRRK